MCANSCLVTFSAVCHWLGRARRHLQWLARMGTASTLHARPPPGPAHAGAAADMDVHPSLRLSPYSIRIHQLKAAVSVLILKGNYHATAVGIRNG
jgi:hypothetical protein